MGLRGQVHYCIRLLVAKDPLYLGTVTDIHFFENVTLAAADFNQRFEIAGVGQFVEVDYAVASIAYDVANNSRADETCTTGDENLHTAQTPRVSTTL
ncbi:hypothetical protein D3C84_277560 [compost metagenome]